MARKVTRDFPSTECPLWQETPIVYLLGDVTDNFPVQIPEGVSLVNISVDLWEEELLALVRPRVL